MVEHLARILKALSLHNKEGEEEEEDRSRKKKERKDGRNGKRVGG